jgi:hypothetical protein
MQGNRGRLLVVLVVLLALTGCKDQAAPAPAPTSAPDAVAPGAGGVAEAKASIPAQTIVLGPGDVADSHPKISVGTVVTWKFNKAGYQLHFMGASPCTSNGDILFAAENQSGKKGGPYVAQCTVGTQVSRGATFRYQLVKNPAVVAPGAPPKYPTYSATPCKGCYIESDDTP